MGMKTFTQLVKLVLLTFQQIPAKLTYLLYDFIAFESVFHLPAEFHNLIG